MSKKRLNIEELRKAKIVADELARKKGVITTESFIDKLTKDVKAPILPGIAPYLPHEETLNATQIILARITKSWIIDNKRTPDRIENIGEFFKYVQKKLKDEEQKFNKQTQKIGLFIKQKKNLKEKTLEEIFSSSRNLSTTKAIHKFFVDSFAVAVVVKRNDTTSEYVDWFLNDWTVSMIKLWHANDKTTPRNKASSSGNAIQ